MMYKLSLLDSPYNEEEVFYCKHCLSLKVRSAGELDYCDSCGSADILQTSIFDWENMYKEKYKITLIN